MKFCSRFGVSFYPKEVLRNLKIQKVALKWWRCFFDIRINPLQCILCGQYILANKFLSNSGYLVEHETLSTLGCQFRSKRSFEKSKNTEVCLNLTLKWQR